MLGLLQAVTLTVSLGVILFFMAIPPVRWAILKAIPPGSGPDEKVIE